MNNEEDAGLSNQLATEKNQFMKVTQDIPSMAELGGELDQYEEDAKEEEEDEGMPLDQFLKQRNIDLGSDDYLY